MARTEPPKIAFGRTLRRYRLALGMSQEALASLADLDRTYISSCERGLRNVSLETICRLAAALGIPPSSLLDFERLDSSKGCQKV
jgi:transcriptional regulator with XRE-family HTH domain